MNRREFIETAVVAASFVRTPKPQTIVLRHLTAGKPEVFDISGVRGYPELNGTYRISHITEETFCYEISAAARRG